MDCVRAAVNADEATTDRCEDIFVRQGILLKVFAEFQVLNSIDVLQFLYRERSLSACYPAEDRVGKVRGVGGLSRDSLQSIGIRRTER